MKYSKTLKILTAITATSIALVGCSSGSEEGSDSKNGSKSDDVLTIYNQKIEIDEALKEYTSLWSEETGYEVEVKSVGAGSNYGATIQAEFQSGNEPDIFISAGQGDFEQWSDVLYDMTGEEWTENTDLEYVNEAGETVGYPVAIEGYGLIANTEMLEQAGLDIDSISTYDDLINMFNVLNEKKDELGIDSPLSFTTKENWVTGNHLFNILLSGSGNDIETATEATKKFIDGDKEALEYNNFDNFTKLLFDNSYGDLSTTDYDTEVSNFATGKTALLFQGNWAIGNIEKAGFDTSKLRFIPLAYNENTAGKLPIGVPMYYVVNKNTDVEIALQFLNDLASTEEGQDFMVNKAAMIPAFTNVEIKPQDPLALDIMKYNEEGNTLPWLFGEFPDGATATIYAPIFDNYYKVGDNEEFIENLKKSVDQI